MTTTTVGELLELLADHDPEAPVMIAHQPGWPLAEVVAGVVHSADSDHDGDDLDTDTECVWLVAGGHEYGRSPYAPGWVFDAV
jgi:hypothetical protein